MIATIKPEILPDMIRALESRQLLNIAKQNERFERVAPQSVHNERLPLMEDGHEFGRVVARIPKAAYFHLLQQKNFGQDGMFSDDGMKDLLKAFPQCRVKTVSGKITSGWTPGMAASRRTVKKYSF